MVCRRVQRHVQERAGHPLYTHQSQALPSGQPWGRSSPVEGSCTWADNTKGTSSPDGYGGSWWSHFAPQEWSHHLLSPPLPQIPAPARTTEGRDDGMEGGWRSKREGRGQRVRANGVIKGRKEWAFKKDVEGERSDWEEGRWWDKFERETRVRRK